MTQDELKTLVGQAAVQYVPAGTVVGVGTGSTVDRFIDALAPLRDRIAGAVSSSVRSTERLKALGIPVLDLNQVESIPVYIDGADEIDGQGHMVKGGGAALTREKIVAALAQQFVCIADESKLVPAVQHDVTGRLVRPGDIAQAADELRALLGSPELRDRLRAGCVTDNGCHILDVRGLKITDPAAMEADISQWPGVVTVGIFARNKASVCLLGTSEGVRTLTF